MVQFDAALAFVMLLLLLSLVVTALVQAAIALFDIRGGNLKSAITTILRQAGVARSTMDTKLRSAIGINFLLDSQMECRFWLKK